MKPLLGSADLMARRGGYAEAKRLLGKIKTVAATRLSPGERKQFQKAEALIASSTGDTGGFVAVLEEIISDDPADGAAMINLARHYEKDGSAESLARASDWYERAEALADLAAKDPAALTDAGAKDRAERLKNEAADAGLRHGFMLNKMGQVGKAVEKLKRSNQLKPREDLRDLLAKLEKQALKEKADAETRQAKLQRDSEAQK
jgi:tetratricopeptide (TPR) repeat protein